MRIRNLGVRNIRSYRSLDLDFHANLNVIRGKSDSGKSALIKALIFAIKNRASKNIRTKGITDDSSVRISDGSNAVTRLKGKANSYILEGRITAKLDAVNKEVPEDVSKLLNLSENNIQEQRDTFFLIDESPGNVSKALNKVSGLSEVDRTLKAVTSAINSLNSSIKKINNDIEETEERIESNEWAITADKELSKIETLEEKISKLEEEISVIDNLFSKFKSIKQELNTFLPDSVLEDYNVFKSIFDRHNEALKEYEMINNLHLQYKNLREQINDCLEIDLSSFQEIDDEISVLITEIEAVDNLQTSYRALKNQYDVIDKMIAKTISKIREIPVCPTCQRPL